MKLLRSTLSAAAALILLPTMALAASAAPAPNDTVVGATAITALPTTITQDTTGATTDDLDAALNAGCGAPATNASVWFSYTDPDGGGVLADMSASSYTGGQLTVLFDEAPPAPEATITVDPRGTAYKDGSARLTGTYSCTNADDVYSDIEGNLTQRVGRVKINGFFFVNPLRCDGAVNSWEAVAYSDNGLFRGGKSATMAFTFACGAFECGVGYTEQTVQLSTNKKS